MLIAIPVRPKELHHLDKAAAPHPERSALGMADMLTRVAADAFRDEERQLRRVSTAALEEEDEEPWSRTNLYRWGPAFTSPAEEKLDALKDEYSDPREDAPFPGVSSTSSTSGRTPNRRMRRKAAAKGRKR